MGRLESLTSLALGRGPYESEVIETTADGRREGGQQYSSNGRPRNPETKRREKEHVRAANEVMQVTGIVEDALAAKFKVAEALINKNFDTLSGLNMIEAGRVALVTGTWGTLGLRRRILLYQPYSHIGILEIIRREREASSVTHLLFPGIPALWAIHLSDFISYFLEPFLDATLGEEDADGHNKLQTEMRSALRIALEVSCNYANLHLRLFATLQQLNLVSSSRMLPSLRSFIPFSPSSPFARPGPLAWNITSVVGFGTSLLRTAAPLLIILIHGRVKSFVSHLVYRPIYRSLPRPMGESMFSGLGIPAPRSGYDAPDHDIIGGAYYRGEDESTLRALEGLPVLERAETRNRPNEGPRDTSDDEEIEVPQAAIISFDVEPSDNVEPSLGSWSAELRSANEPKPSENVVYNTTGLTMLPTIMAAEGLRDVAAGLLVLPVEAVMVRLIGRAFRQSAGLDVGDIWEIFPSLNTISFMNVLSAAGIQIIFTGVVWTGFTISNYVWASGPKVFSEEKFLGEDSATQST